MKGAGQNDAIGHLFNPNNVVLVGASDRPGHWSQRVFDNLKRFGFTGKAIPVNPNRSDIWGTRCYPRLDALPEPPDHLAIFTSAETTIKILSDGGAAGARSATVYAAGFGEGGDPDGQRLGVRLRETIARTGLAVIGPNCMGAASGVSKFSSVPDESLQAPRPSPIAVVVQSGAMCTSINRAINDLGLKSGYLASCGSQFGCKISEFIDYFAEQPELRVILCYIEAVPDAERFLEAARRARANGKTVVAVKVGATESARAAALAHTGSLAGSTEAFDAVAGTAGVVRVSSFEDAIEAVEFLARLPLPRGRHIALMTSSGALRGLATEAAERAGAMLAVLSDATKDALNAVLGDKGASNPFDTKRTIPAEQYAKCLDTLVDAPEVDIVLTAEDMPLDTSVARRTGNLLSIAGVSKRAASVGKTVAMFTPLTVSLTEYGRSVRAQIPDVPVMRETERTLRIVTKLARAGARPVHAGPFLAPPADTDFARRWRARAAALAGPTALNEVESKLLLGAYGIALPPERLVITPDDAALAVQQVGFPVVLKAVSAALPHKSDAGLVMLNLSDAGAVRDAAATLLARASALSVRLDGILVAKHIFGGIETVLGIQRDVEMGPVIMFGMGGVLVELFKDVSFAPAFLDREMAREMVLSTRVGRLIDGFRGKQGDLDSVCDALVNLGRLARDLGDVIEAVDVNPFAVCDKGAFALDALVVLRPPSRLTGA